MPDLGLACPAACPKPCRPMPNSFGKIFSISTWGESHGPSVGVVIDGVPPALPLNESEVQADLDRRRPGQSEITTPRKEADAVEFLSGLFEGRTTGHPIAMLVRTPTPGPGPTTRCAGLSGPRTPISLTRPNMASAIIAAADAPPRAKPSAVWPPAP